MSPQGKARRDYLMSTMFNQKPRYCKASVTLYCKSQNSLDCAVISCEEGCVLNNKEVDY